MTINPLWIVAIFLVVFPVFWSGVCVLISFVTGWRGLAADYRGRLDAVDGRVSMSSGRMGIGNYNNVLNVAVGPRGMELSVFPLLAVGSPPLAIPWSDVVPVRRYRLLGMFDRLQLRIGGRVTLVLAGSAARLVEQALGRSAAATPGAAEVPAVGGG